VDCRVSCVLLDKPLHQRGTTVTQLTCNASTFNRVQLVRELPIVGGDERKVGYYTGIIVRLGLPQCECTKNIILGIPPLCCGGHHGLSLEPSFRPHWSQARALSVPWGCDGFNGSLRPLPFFRGHRV